MCAVTSRAYRRGCPIDDRFRESVPAQNRNELAVN
jgi:hypothetical protein